MNEKQFRYLWNCLIWIMLQAIPSESNGGIVCGNANKLFDSCFSSDISNSSQVFVKQFNSIPFSNEEIQDYCNLFERGIHCYNEYADKCISDAANRRLIEGEIMPAKNFYEMLCKDKLFKRDYLVHRDCFRYIEKDWDTCTKHFQIVLENEFTRTQRERKSNINTQYMHFCCARYAYENCVGNSARAKCKADSARFTRNLVELLSSERQFKNCAKIEDSLCSSAERRKNFFIQLFTAFTLGFFFNNKLGLL